MNELHRTIFFDLLRSELVHTVLPGAQDEASRRIAAMASQQLNRMLAEDIDWPALRESARTSYRALLPSLQSCIDGALCERLKAALDAALTDWSKLEEVLSEVMDALFSGNAAAHELAPKVIAVDAALRARTEQAYKLREQGNAGTQEKKEPPGLNDAQQARLLAFLKQRFPREESLRIAAVKPLLGGFSKLTLFIELADNVELPGTLVMRRDSPFMSVSSSVVMEFPLLQALYAAGVRVPQPFAVDNSGDVVGTPFVLLSRAPGHNLGDFLTVQPNHPDEARDLARCLAKLHAAPIGDLEKMLPGGGKSLHDFMVAQIAHYENMWKSVTQQRASIMNAVFAWLKQNIELVEGRRTIVHRDVGFHNLLVHERKVSVLLDWEAAVIGPPVEDIALVYFVIPQMASWDDFVATYEEAAGVKMDRRQIDYFVMFSMVRTVVSVACLTDPVFAGKHANFQLYYLGNYFGDVMMQRIASKLAEVMGATPTKEVPAAKATAPT